MILNVVVEEAECLEAKDANGYSDPYCMLGIRPTHTTTTVTQVRLLHFKWLLLFRIISLQFPSDGSIDLATRSSSLASDPESSENGEEWLPQLTEKHEHKLARKYTRWVSLPSPPLLQTNFSQKHKPFSCQTGIPLIFIYIWLSDTMADMTTRKLDSSM